MASVLTQDWTRNPETLTRLVLATFRLGTTGRMRLLYRVANLVVVRTMAGADLAPCTVGPGLRLHHAGRGVCLHRAAVLGAEVTLFQHVTVGATRRGVPRIGDRVYIGAGATIVGPVTVGDDATIGANATVTSDVPADVTVVAPPPEVR